MTTDIVTTPEARETIDAWNEGWLACREYADTEVADAYARGLAARQVDTAFGIELWIAATLAFIAGVIVCASLVA